MLQVEMETQDLMGGQVPLEMMAELVPQDRQGQLAVKEELEPQDW